MSEQTQPVAEKREEICSVASKLVTVTIFRRYSQECPVGEIVDFHCAAGSPTCQPRCTYKMMLDDI